MADLTDILSNSQPDVMASTPDIQATDVPNSSVPQGPTNPTPVSLTSPTPAPANQPISWRDVLRGALAGMSGAAQGTRGRGGFAQGLGLGAGAALEDQANQQKMRMAQAESTSRIKFQDAQSANLVAETLIRDKQLHQMDQQEQDRHNSASVETIDRLQALGLSPTLVIPNNTGGAEANAALQQLTDSHGAVPPLFTINVGNQILAYDLAQLAAKPQILQEVNRVRAIQGASPIDQQTWQRMDPKMRNEMTNSALNFNTPMPSEASLLQYQNYLTTAQAQPDSPEKVANVKLLTGITTRMQQSLDAAKTRAAEQAQSQAEATGERQKNIGAANEANARVKLIDAQIKDMQSGVGGDEFDSGWQSPLNKKEFQKRQDDFLHSTEYKNLQQVQGSKQLFDSIVNDPKFQKGDLSGAQSVVGLFAAIGISVTPMQGKGMRINKDVILSHEQARGLDQATLQKLNSLKNGQVITPQQLKDYSGIADAVYAQAYINANDALKQRGLPQNLIPEGHNKPIDSANWQIFLTLSNGDSGKATSIAKKHGWLPPTQQR